MSDKAALTIGLTGGIAIRKTEVANRFAGLGLAIVEGVVTAHGGTVSVDSQVGEGSTFTLEIPIRRHDAAVRCENGE
ncbi:MAG: dephospho-CoA kinase [Chloroflexi bacterium]|nr:dephospho-CoA kinase [Chloroflexota bacterium]